MYARILPDGLFFVQTGICYCNFAKHVFDIILYVFLQEMFSCGTRRVKA